MYEYPLQLSFKVVTFGTRVRVSDASGRQVAYVRKKKFRLKEDVTVYAGEDERSVRFRIRADRVLDFSASYAVLGPDGRRIGAVGRDGMRSLWSSSYGVADARGKRVGAIGEENPWIKVLDSLVAAIPFADALGGLFLHPAYLVNLRGSEVLRVQKERALMEGRFSIEKRGDFPEEDEELLLASIIMMVILERDRG